MRAGRWRRPIPIDILSNCQLGGGHPTTTRHDHHDRGCCRGPGCRSPCEDAPTRDHTARRRLPARRPGRTGRGSIVRARAVHAARAAGARRLHPSCWAPAPNTSWQWQLSGTVRRSVAAQMYDIDMFEATPALVADLHARRRRRRLLHRRGLVGAVAARRRPLPRRGDRQADAGLARRALARHPPPGRARAAAPVAHRPLRGQGLRRRRVRQRRRLPGGHRVPPHRRRPAPVQHVAREPRPPGGLAVALKNDLDQVPALLPYFDLALDEQCFQYSECGLLKPFITAGKPVFEVEYGRRARIGGFCAQGQRPRVRVAAKAPRARAVAHPLPVDD